MNVQVANKPRKWNQELGKRGEKFAADFYRRSGAEIIAHNVHYACGELDLIVREPDRTVVFVEVKTRSSNSYGGAESVTRRKVQRMRKAALQWLQGKPRVKIRFDVVVLVVQGDSFSMEYFKGVDAGAR